jgi:hypothetical protein
LKKANELMKIMSGAVPTAEKYEKEAQRMLDTVQQDVLALNEIVNTLGRKEKLADIAHGPV